MISHLWRRPGGVSCRTVGRLLQAYLDGELDDSAGAAVAAHLEECRRCGLEASTFRALKAALSSHRRDLHPAQVDRLREFGEHLAAGRPPE